LAHPRKGSAKPLAALIDGCIEPALRKRGFVASDVLRQWEAVVGQRLAAGSQPIEIKWPRRPARASPDDPVPSATLMVRVEGALALEFDYARALIIERINALFGWRCIGRITIKQGPVIRPSAPAKRMLRPLRPEERAALAGLVSGAEENLGAALLRLGEAVISSRRPAPPISKA
jgi:hypothetical protein